MPFSEKIEGGSGMQQISWRIQTMAGVASSVVTVTDGYFCRHTKVSLISFGVKDFVMGFL